MHPFGGGLIEYRSSLKRVATLPALVALAAAVLVPDTTRAETSAFAAPGRIESAGGKIALGTAATGTVKEVRAREWDRVRAKDVLVTLDCRPIEAEVQARAAQASAAEAAFDRVRNGPRPGEIAVAVATVGSAKARADEAQKALERNRSLQEGVSVTTARVLELQRDAAISAAQLAEAQARLSLLREGSREEDVREAQSNKSNAVAELENARARLEQCFIRAPVSGVVADVLVTPGQFLSLAVPTTLLQIIPEGDLMVRVEVDPRDLARVCVGQSVTVKAEAFPNVTIGAKVEAISPVLTPRTFGSPWVEARGKDIEPVLLRLDRGGPDIPIGLPVTAYFAACRPKG